MWDLATFFKNIRESSFFSLHIPCFCLSAVYCGHCNKKWDSFSTWSLQNLQNLSYGGVFGLEYLPVSVANECALILNFFNLYFHIFTRKVVRRFLFFCVLQNIKYIKCFQEFLGIPYHIIVFRKKNFLLNYPI
jgi:hypothetical protein